MAEVVFWYVGEENRKHYIVKQNAEEKILGCYTPCECETGNLAGYKSSLLC